MPNQHIPSPRATTIALDFARMRVLGGARGGHPSHEKDSAGEREGALLPWNKFHNPATSWVAVFPFRRVRARRKPIVQKDDVAGSRKGNTATQLFSNALSLFPARQRPGAPGRKLSLKKFSPSGSELGFGAQIKHQPRMSSSWGAGFRTRMKSSIAPPMVARACVHKRPTDV